MNLDRLNTDYLYDIMCFPHRFLLEIAKEHFSHVI